MSSIKWDLLEHAYGDASDILGLLKDLENYPISEHYQDEPFFSLWSSLCHQGTVYTASFAAVPLIVKIIEQAPELVSYDYFLLPLEIHIAHLKGNGPPIPKDLATEYFNAIKSLPILAAKITSSEEIMARVLSATIAANFGYAGLAESILELNPNTVVEFEEWHQSR